MVRLKQVKVRIGDTGGWLRIRERAKGVDMCEYW